MVCDCRIDAEENRRSQLDRLRKMLISYRPKSQVVPAFSKRLKRFIAWLESLQYDEYGTAPFTRGLPVPQVLPRYVSESSAPRKCGKCGQSIEFLPDIELIMCPYCGNRLESKW